MVDPLCIIPSQTAPDADTPKEKPLVWSRKVSKKERKLSLIPKVKSRRNDSEIRFPGTVS